MFKFTLKRTPNHTLGIGEDSEITHVLNEEHASLPEVIKAFEYFLRGCGYHFDGGLEIVDSDGQETPFDD